MYCYLFVVKLGENAIATKTIYSICLIALLLAGCATPTGHVTKEPIKIGVVGPFSGQFSAKGEWVQQGSQIGAADVTREYGLDIQLVYEDSGCSTKEMLTAFENLRHLRKG